MGSPSGEVKISIANNNLESVQNTFYGLILLLVQMAILNHQILVS
jgi:hypothetical protein